MKTEIWNGHKIRFVDVNGEWCGVAKDVAEALGFKNAMDATKRLKSQYKGVTKVPTLGGEQEMIVLSEKGMYRLIIRSNKPEAEAF